MTRHVRDRAFALASLSAFAVQSVAGPLAPWWVPWGAALGCVAILGLARDASAPVRSLAAMMASLALATRLPVFWQPAMLMGILGFVALGRVVPALRARASWRARGTVPLGWTAVVGGVTPPALFAWLLIFKPDLSDVVRGYLPDLPFGVLLVGALVFVVVNAALEEIIWRGAIQDALEPTFGTTAAAALQAASFGLQHAWGVPRGAVGVVLVTIWGTMLGLLRNRSRGLLAPFLAHAVADATIAV